MKIMFGDEKIECVKAIKGLDYIKVYDKNGAESSFMGISDFTKFEIVDGAWSSPEPTPQEDLMAMAVDTEYRVTLLELGVK